MKSPKDSEQDSNVIPLFGERKSQSPRRLNEDEVAALLLAEFGIDLLQLPIPDTELVSSSLEMNDRCDEDMDERVQHIMNIATTVIYELADPNGFPTLRIVPQDPAASD